MSPPILQISLRFLPPLFDLAKRADTIRKFDNAVRDAIDAVVPSYVGCDRPAKLVDAPVGVPASVSEIAAMALLQAIQDQPPMTKAWVSEPTRTISLRDIWSRSLQLAWAPLTEDLSIEDPAELAASVTAVLYDRFLGLAANDETLFRIAMLDSIGSRPLAQPSWNQNTELPVRITSTLPPQNPWLVGRDQVLGRLSKSLDRHGHAAVTQPSIVHGLGGIGKTAVAVEHIYRNLTKYDIIWFVDAEYPRRIPDQMRPLAHMLGIDHADRVNESQLALELRTALANRSKWLIVLDNVDDPRAMARWIPKPGRGHVIVTTRDKSLAHGGDDIEVGALTDDEGAAFLDLRLESELPKSDLRSVSRRLGGLPLALEQAAILMDGPAALSAIDFISLLDRRGSELFQAVGAGSPSEPRDDVYTTLTLALENLFDIQPDSRLFLAAVAMMAPDELPLPIASMVASMTETSDPPAIFPPFRLAERLSLLTIRGDAVYMHRMVREVIRDYLRGDSTQAGQIAIDVVSSWISVMLRNPLGVGSERRIAGSHAISVIAACANIRELSGEARNLQRLLVRSMAGADLTIGAVVEHMVDGQLVAISSASAATAESHSVSESTMLFFEAATDALGEPQWPHLANSKLASLHLEDRSVQEGTVLDATLVAGFIEQLEVLEEPDQQIVVQGDPKILLPGQLDPKVLIQARALAAGLGGLRIDPHRVAVGTDEPIVPGDIAIAFLAIVLRLVAHPSPHEGRLHDDSVQYVLDGGAKVAFALGATGLWRELEDQAFASLFPERFRAELRRNDSVPRDNFKLLSEGIASAVGSEDATVTWTSAPAWARLRARLDDDDHPVTGYVEISVPTVRDCYYSGLGIVHTLWPPFLGSFHDYIAMPKVDLYQALHTVVKTPSPVFVRIATHKMRLGMARRELPASFSDLHESSSGLLGFGPEPPSDYLTSALTAIGEYLGLRRRERSTGY